MPEEFFCKPTCHTGYTAADFRRDAEPRDQGAAAPPQAGHPTTLPKE
jgi:hypothetical protein